MIRTIAFSYEYMSNNEVGLIFGSKLAAEHAFGFNEFTLREHLENYFKEIGAINASPQEKDITNGKFYRPIFQKIK